MADAANPADAPPADDASATGGVTDERLAHRGPVQQLLTRPEIGAMLGAVGVWLLFWLVSLPFGTVGGTANFLDVAAYLGLMAVPVALLMIGGEFDLSSGAMTGATAIALILLGSDINGAGLGLHVAVPLSLAFALAIGWFNGTLVEKTSLPSFIVTLGTFFVLIGAKLGFSKLFTNKVLVEGLDEAPGYDFWNGIFGARWLRNGHIWDGRDWAWAGLLVFGGIVLLLGTLELTYARRSSIKPGGYMAALVGLVAGVGGFAGLLTVGNSGSDWTFGTLTAAGCIVGVAGWCTARYKPRQPSNDTGSERSAASPYVIAGVLAVVLSIVVTASMDSSDAAQLGFLGGAPGRAVFAIGMAVTGVLAVMAALGRLTPGYPAIGALISGVPTVSYMVTVQAARAILFTGLLILAVVLFTAAAGRVQKPFVISITTSVAIAVLAFFMQSEASSRKLRVELFTVLLLVALLLAVSAVARHLSQRRQAAPPPPDMSRWVRVAAIAGAASGVVAAFVELILDGDDILYSLITGAVKGGIVAFAVYAVGTLWKTIFTGDEGVGRALVPVGIGAILLGVTAKLLFVTQAELEAVCRVDADGSMRCPETQFGVVVLSFLIFAAVGSWVLMRTQFGSWILAVGGNKEAARSVGVPAARTKTILFMLVSAAAWVTGMLIAFRLTAVQANVGDSNEFRYIIVAVVGGNLLTGGYGSALGAAIGAVIWGMISQGIGFAQWNSDWRFLVLGALLLVAVLVNNYVRGRAEKMR